MKEINRVGYFSLPIIFIYYVFPFKSLNIISSPFSHLQVAFVTKRKNELEKRVEELLSERENLNNTLDDTSDKIILLERHAREQDCQVHKY